MNALLPFGTHDSLIRVGEVQPVHPGTILRFDHVHSDSCYCVVIEVSDTGSGKNWIPVCIWDETSKPGATIQIRPTYMYKDDLGFPGTSAKSRTVIPQFVRAVLSTTGSAEFGVQAS